MKPRALAGLLWVWLVLLLSWLGLSASVEDAGGRDETLAILLFGLDVASVAGALLALVLLTIAWAFARSLACRVRVGRWVGAGALVAVTLACVTAAAGSKWYWGYWFARPEASVEWWELASLDGLSFVGCDRDPLPVRCTIDAGDEPWAAVRSCEADAYECTDERLPFALHRAKLLPPRVPPVTADALPALERALTDDRLLAPQEERYRGNAHLGGFVATGRTAHGTPVIAAVLGGAEVSNDHRPVYELALHAGGATKRRTFFYDTAGIEGFEFPSAAIVLSVAAFLIWVPAAAGVVLLASIGPIRRAP